MNAWKGGSRLPIPPPEALSSAETHHYRLEALLKEYEFVESLVPLYRGFEMQAVGLSVAIFAAAIGFAAQALENDSPRLVYFLGAVLPWPLSMLLLAMVGMEVRIIRASRHVNLTIAPAIRDLTGGVNVLTWEIAPGRYLTPQQRKYQGSWVYALIISVEGLVGAVAGLVGATQDREARWPLGATAIAGLMLFPAPTRCGERVSCVASWYVRFDRGDSGSVNPTWGLMCQRSSCASRNGSRATYGKKPQPRRLQ